VSCRSVGIADRTLAYGASASWRDPFGEGTPEALGSTRRVAVVTDEGRPKTACGVMARGSWGVQTASGADAPRARRFGEGRRSVGSDGPDRSAVGRSLAGRGRSECDPAPVLSRPEPRGLARVEAGVSSSAKQADRGRAAVTSGVCNIVGLSSRRVDQGAQSGPSSASESGSRAASSKWPLAWG